MFLTNADIAELTDLRRALHRAPEVSRHESKTAHSIQAALAATAPDTILTGLGGHGVAAIYDGAAPGPTVMLRAELDALPIHELPGVPYRSEIDGAGHMCGHDGHMVMLLAVARGLGRARPARGRVIALFQPAEEDGSGAAAVIADPRFDDLAPDYAFALHNMPGLPLGLVTLTDGAANCASVGMRVMLTGRTAHASMPETGLSPAPALAALIPTLAALGRGGAMTDDFALVTITHARLGEPTFGIAPGHGEVRATLRTITDAAMDRLRRDAVAAVDAAAAATGLAVAIDWHDDFARCANHPDAVAILRAAMDAEGVAHQPPEGPMRASEDFGRFGATARSAMFLLGAGEDRPALHNPDYDFPDALIPIGARVFMRAVRDLLG
ncbi:MAG: amidohydrolase [Paracoccaceae bacterium]|jgi:amidohydrolase